MDTPEKNISVNNDSSFNYPKSYEFISNFGVDELLKLTEEKQKEIDNYKPLDTNLWDTIRQKLRVHWTYDSNAIEGSKLSLGETMFFLQEGITAEGKSFKDYLDARNHAEAIDLLYDIINNNREISVGVIKEINALLMSGVKYTKAIDQYGNPSKKPTTPGEYKKLPNHVLQPDGTIHYYAEPLHVATEMDTLVSWIKKNINKIHPVAVSAIAHYNMVRIHPFDDGNGRGARILMNLILIKKKFPPAIVRSEDRRKYISSIMEADNGDINSFIEFISTSLLKTQEMILEDLKKSPQTDS